MVDFATLRVEHERSMRKLVRDVDSFRHQSHLNLQSAYRDKAKRAADSSTNCHLNAEHRSNHSLVSNQTVKSKYSTKSSRSTTSSASKKSKKSVRSNETNLTCSSLRSRKSINKWTTMEPETIGAAKMYKLFFDMCRYKQSEINVRVEGEHLIVYARHEGVEGKKYSLREFERKHRLPPNCDPLLMQASLSVKGLLTVYAFTYN